MGSVLHVTIPPPGVLQGRQVLKPLKQQPVRNPNRLLVFTQVTHLNVFTTCVCVQTPHCCTLSNRMEMLIREN